ncbi:MAG: hypothetical protein K9H64_07500 [Bacteroidales bacterium]|nr:hypothetical protein [Bacteroidales bacterium]MCF8455614.1 hypothetical protein [Bacteroidales bacterium]
MNLNKRTLWAAYKLLAIILVAFLVFKKNKGLFNELDLILLILLIGNVVFTVSRAAKLNKEEIQGFPIDDEMSNRIKYKAGYFAFFISMPIWIFIYVFMKLNHYSESIFAWGIFLSALSYIVAKFVIKQWFNEK